MTELQPRFHLPYFDRILDAVSKRNGAVESLVGEHVHWGLFAGEDLSAEGVRLAQERMIERFFAPVSLASGMAFLDVGCGFGGTIQFLGQRLEGCQFTGLNIDQRQLERAQEQVTMAADSGNQVRWVAANACQLPFDDESFDCVYGLESVFHFPSRLIFMQEANRVLKPGGMLLLSDFVVAERAAIPLFFHFAMHGRALRRTYGTHSWPPSEKKYRRLASQAGFSQCQFEDVTRATLPTYDALLANAHHFEKWDAYAEANRCLQKVSAAGWLQYILMAFRR